MARVGVFHCVFLPALLVGCAAPRATCPPVAVAPGAPARAGELRFRPVHAVTLRDVKARDENGAVAVTESGEALRLGGGGGRDGARHVGARRELHVEYTVSFHESAEAGAPYAEAIEVHAAGEDVLALPVPAADEAKVPIRVRIKTGGIANGGASSFGLGRDVTFEARPSDLLGGFFLGGETGRAEFQAGVAKPGRVFTRVSGIPDDRC